MEGYEGYFLFLLMVCVSSLIFGAVQSWFLFRDRNDEGDD